MTSVPPLGTGAAKTVANRDITIRAQRRIDMNFFIVIPPKIIYFFAKAFASYTIA